MHPKVLTKAVLLLILVTSATISSTQAASLTNVLNCINTPGEDSGPGLGMLNEETASSALFIIRNCLGVPLTKNDSYSEDSQSALFGRITNHSGSGGDASVNSQATAANLPGSNTLGFHADVAADTDAQRVAADSQFKDALHVQGLAGTASSYLNKGNAVPIPAAAWLFSSALFGFVLFANRRKV